MSLKKDLESDYVSEKFHEPHQAGDTEESTSRAGLEIWRDATTSRTSSVPRAAT